MWFSSSRGTNLADVLSRRSEPLVRKNRCFAFTPEFAQGESKVSEEALHQLQEFPLFDRFREECLRRWNLFAGTQEVLERFRISTTTSDSFYDNCWDRDPFMLGPTLPVYAKSFQRCFSPLKPGSKCNWQHPKLIAFRDPGT